MKQGKLGIDYAPVLLPWIWSSLQYKVNFFYSWFMYCLWYPMNKCLVTLTLGESYKKRFEEYSRASWVSYCNRHSIQLIVLDKPLDDSLRAQKRSPAWQKLLMLSQD